MLLGAFNIEGIFNKENFRDCETSNFAKVRFQLYCTALTVFISSVE